ncbi:MAG: hypothetical protein ABIB71_08245 [Candidatus Woesearchaeota archaeon]
MRYAIILAFFALAIILSGCAPQEITSDQAVVVAQEYVNEHVSLFSEREGEPQTVEKAHAEVMQAVAQEGADGNPVWSIIIEVSSDVEGEVKSTEISIDVDRNTGQVVRFNNIKV